MVGYSIRNDLQQIQVQMGQKKKDHFNAILISKTFPGEGSLISKSKFHFILSKIGFMHFIFALPIRTKK
jgi:stress-induced morphogen